MSTAIGPPPLRGARPGEGIGLTVNGVTPGYVATDTLAAIPDKVLDRLGGLDT